MPYIALGLLALVAVMVLAKAFVAVNPATLAQGLRWAGVGIAVLGIGVLTASGRISLAGFLLPVLYALLRGWRPAWLAAWFAGFGERAAQPTPGQTSSIRTAFLELVLDHDSGALSGQVLRGGFRGQRIEALRRGELIELWRETAAEDAQSAQLVETCLDRGFPDWRDDPAAAAGGARARAGAMGREEALRILGRPASRRRPRWPTRIAA
jgi:hypothetical protein